MSKFSALILIEQALPLDPMSGYEPGSAWWASCNVLLRASGRTWRFTSTVSGSGPSELQSGTRGDSLRARKPTAVQAHDQEQPPSNVAISANVESGSSGVFLLSGRLVSS